MIFNERKHYKIHNKYAIFGTKSTYNIVAAVTKSNTAYELYFIFDLRVFYPLVKLQVTL